MNTTAASAQLQRRQRPWVQSILFFALTAMELAWITPLVMIFLPESRPIPSLLLLAGLGLVLLVMLLVAQALEKKQVASPQFELLVAGVLIVMGLLAIRLLIFSEEPPGSLHWLRTLLSAGDKLTHAAIIWGIMAFLWWRAVTFSQREINFFVIASNFKKGMLAMLLAVALLRALHGKSAMIFVYVFFFFGLLAVALGRTEEKARMTGTGRVAIHTHWLQVIGVSTAMVMGLAALWGRLWNLEHFQVLERWLSPILAWLAPYGERLALFLLRWLNPLLNWLAGLLRSAVGGESGEEITQGLTQGIPAANVVMGEEQTTTAAPDWLSFLFHTVLPIVLGLLVLLALVLWLRRRRRRQQRTFVQEELLQVERLPRSGMMDPLRRGLTKLKEMTGRWSAKKGFYTTFTIRHVYANLQKLAAKHDAPRHPSWTPNDYLPHLIAVFPEQEEALQHITKLYNDVEYGQLPTDPAALTQLQAAWEAIQSAAENSHD